MNIQGKYKISNSPKILVLNDMMLNLLPSVKGRLN